MSKSFFQRQAIKLKLKTSEKFNNPDNPQKNAAAGVPSDSGEDVRMDPTESVPSSKQLRIYDDTDTCRLLGLRKRAVVADRKERTRGSDWGIEGFHAGMSETWILKRNPKADLAGLVPIKDGDGITTVKVLGKCTNNSMLIAKRVCDGQKVMVRVRDARIHFVGDEMDARAVGKVLQFAEDLNPERY